MTWLELIGLLITAVIVPYVVQLIKTETITGRRAFWIATGTSVAAGVVVFFLGGIPLTPLDCISCILAAIGAVQIAYAAFKSVGITNEWLNALGAINYKVENTPDIAAKNQALADKAEDALNKTAEKVD